MDQLYVEIPEGDSVVRDFECITRALGIIVRVCSRDAFRVLPRYARLEEGHWYCGLWVQHERTSLKMVRVVWAVLIYDGEGVPQCVQSAVHPFYMPRVMRAHIGRFAMRNGLITSFLPWEYVS